MIEITREYTRAAAARAIPGAFFEDGAWRLVNPEPRAAVVALKLFPELTHHYPELVELRDSTLRDAAPIDFATPYWESLGRPASVGAQRVEAAMAARGYAWKQGDGHWQQSDLTYAIACLKQHRAFYLGWSRGMGKTLGTAAVIDSLDLKSTLIIAPNSAKAVTWADELGWACPWLEVLTLPNDAAKRVKCLERATYLHRERQPFVLVVHYEALAVIAGKPKTARGKVTLGEGWKKLKIHWDLKAADEGHRFANPDSLQTRAACKIPADMRMVMSGSVFQNRWEEVYGPLHFLFPERYKSRHRDWGNRFFDYVENGYGRVNVGILPGREQAMREELGVFMVVRDKVNKAIPNVVTVELSPTQRRIYDQMVETLFAELPDGTRLKSGVGIALLTRLRQIACGLDCFNPDALQDSTKLDAVLDVIRKTWDRGDDYLIFGWYRASARALHRRLESEGIEAWIIDGDVPMKERTQIVRSFQNGQKRVLIGTLATMSESLNIQRASHVIRVDRSFNPAMNQQAVDRADRQGQKRTVYLTDIVAKDTVDDLVVMPNLANKDALRAVVFGGSGA